VRSGGEKGDVPCGDTSPCVGWVEEEQISLPFVSNEDDAILCPSCVFNPPGGVIFSAPSTALNRVPNDAQGLPPVLSPFSNFFKAENKSNLSVSALELQLIEVTDANTETQTILKALTRSVAESVGLSMTDVNTDSEILKQLSQFLQHEDASRPAVNVFLEVFRICMRDKWLAVSGVGHPGTFVLGAAHSPFRTSTTLFQ
jgi:hypothetical protein